MFELLIWAAIAIPLSGLGVYVAKLLTDRTPENVVYVPAQTTDLVLSQRELGKTIIRELAQMKADNKLPSREDLKFIVNSLWGYPRTTKFNKSQSLEPMEGCLHSAIILIDTCPQVTWGIHSAIVKLAEGVIGASLRVNGSSVEEDVDKWYDTNRTMLSIEGTIQSETAKFESVSVWTADIKPSPSATGREDFCPNCARVTAYRSYSY